MFDKSCREYQNTHFVMYELLSGNRVLCNILWKSKVWPDRPHRWRYNRAHALCILDNWGYKHTHWYVIFIAFPWQQWLCERPSILCYMRSACLAATLAVLWNVSQHSDSTAKCVLTVRSTGKLHTRNIPWEFVPQENSQNHYGLMLWSTGTQHKNHSLRICATGTHHNRTMSW